MKLRVVDVMYIILVEAYSSCQEDMRIRMEYVRRDVGHNEDGMDGHQTSCGEAFVAVAASREEGVHDS